jgi:uncharacterized membrane protein YphA (DoxX/SURF4 family)
MNGNGATLARLFASGFLAVLFLQSGLDKVLDRAGNVAYFRSVFERSPLRRFSKALLTLITLGEVGAGALSAAGFLVMVTSRGRDSEMAFAGALLATVCIFSLFTGLRLTKDYSSAAGIVPYFLSCLAALVLLG